MLPKLETILYCTQIGPNSAYIYRHAMMLADCADAKVHILHVVETLTPRQEAMVEGYVGRGTLHDIVEHEEEVAKERLYHRIEALCDREGQDMCVDRLGKIMVLEGHPADVILEQVDQLGADMVIMGASSTTPLMDALLGDTAEKVIRHSRVPVMTVQVPKDFQEDHEISDI